VRRLGFSLIEVLSPCPRFEAVSVEAQRWVRDVMEKTFPLGVFAIAPRSTAEATGRMAPHSKRFRHFGHHNVESPEVDSAPKATATRSIFAYG